MSKQQSGNILFKNALFNVVLVGLGLVVLALLYAFVSRTITPPADPLREANPAELVGDIIQVEVRNGCGVAGVAETFTHFLRQSGFDVVEVGNYRSFDQPRTLIFDRVGDPEAARKVAEALGLPEDRIVEEIRPDYFLDASVVIGQDYASLPPYAEEE